LVIQPTSEDAWDERLQCHVVSLAYDFSSHTGRLYLVAQGCCDRDGCLELFQAIDPEVRAIQTYSGDQPDMAFRKMGTEWMSVWPKKS
jgi:hypothetical protein